MGSEKDKIVRFFFLTNAKPADLKCDETFFVQLIHLSDFLSWWDAFETDMQLGLLDEALAHHKFDGYFEHFYNFLAEFHAYYLAQPTCLRVRSYPWETSIPKLLKFFPPSAAEETSALEKVEQKATPYKGSRFVHVSAPKARSDFAGRKEELSELRKFFIGNPGKSAAAVITGSPGSGKTQLARQFVEESLRAYDLICWIGSSGLDGQLKTSLQQSQDIRNIALSLAIPGADDEDVTRKDLLAWLAREISKYQKRLFILDNIDWPESFRNVAELTDGSHVVITSVVQPWDDSSTFGLKLDLDQRPLDSRDGVAFLLQRSARPGSDADDARKVGIKLGWHMLALEQAASYVSWQRITFGEYLHRLSEQPDELLDARAPKEHRTSAAATFNLLVKALKRQSPLAFKTLCLACCFSPDAVPATLFWEQQKQLEPLLKRTFRQQRTFEEECLNPLGRLSLLMPAISAEGGHADLRRVHRVVVLLLHAWCGPKFFSRYKIISASILATRLGTTSWSDLDFWQRSPWLLSNVEAVASKLMDQKAPISPLHWRHLPAGLIRALIHGGNYEGASNLIETGINLAKSNARRAGAKRRPWQIALHTFYHHAAGLHAAQASEAKEAGIPEKTDYHNWASVDAARKSVETLTDVYRAKNSKTAGHLRCLGCRYLSVGRIGQASELISPSLKYHQAYLARRLRLRYGLKLEQLTQSDARKLKAADLGELSYLIYDHYLLGVVAFKKQDFDAAERHFRSALFFATVLDFDGKNSFDVASCAVQLAETLKAQGKVGEVDMLEQQAGSILRRSYVRYNCAIDVPEARKKLNAPRPQELESLSKRLRDENG